MHLCSVGTRVWSEKGPSRFKNRGPFCTLIYHYTELGRSVSVNTRIADRRKKGFAVSSMDIDIDLVVDLV